MQTVFPTGTTIFKPEKCCNGYTLYPSGKDGVGAVLIDMNGNLVRSWPRFDGFMINLLPEGRILGGQTGRVTKAYDHTHGADDVVQEDWRGNQEWKFDRAVELEIDGKRSWSARQNHDPGSPDGTWNALRDHSRVLEINPVTLEIVWQFTALSAGFPCDGEDLSKFYSRYKSAAQRLPNGNTLITESNCGRVFEVTCECEIVWEYTSPYNLAEREGLFLSDVFRAYRYPYDWVPELDKPAERAVVPPANGEFRIAPVPE